MKLIKKLFYALICRVCKRDINAIGQDNMSSSDRPMCEDCYNDFEAQKF